MTMSSNPSNVTEDGSLDVLLVCIEKNSYCYYYYLYTSFVSFKCKIIEIDIIQVLISFHFKGFS